MASVRKKDGSAMWFACYKQPTGQSDAKGRPIFKRVQRSTGTTDKDRAQQMAISFERAAVAAAEKRWTERSARRFLDEMKAITGISVADTEPTAPFLKRWLAGRKPTMKPAAHQKYADAIDAFLAFLGDTGSGGPLGDVTPKVISNFRDAELSSGKSAATVNKALMILGQALEEAVMHGIYATNPARGLNVKGEKRNAQKRRAFTFEQFRQLVHVTAVDWSPPGRKIWANQVLSKDWQPFVMLLGYTGGRQQEVAKLRWGQIDLAGRRITLERTKNGDEHWIPLHPALADYLKTMAPGRADAYVLPTIATTERRHLSNKFRLSILPRIGIVQEYHTGGDKGRKLAPYSLHSLRHSLSTWLNEAGVSEMVRMRIIGHESKDVSRGYTHTELAQLADALSMVPTVFPLA